MHIKVKTIQKTLKTVRIFVSSIFRDIHAERDYEAQAASYRCGPALGRFRLLIAEGKYRNRRSS